MSSYETRLCVSISEIKKQVENGSIEEALVSLERLWKVTCRIKRNNEVISCSNLHSEETVENAKTENRIIKGSGLYPHEILLAK
jgi:hypothetical protein